MTKFSLSTYLMISVLIIVSGILWILFTQIDRSYKYPIFSPDLQREHSDIIQRVYQLKPLVEQDLPVVTPETIITSAPAAPKLVPAVPTLVPAAPKLTPKAQTTNIEPKTSLPVETLSTVQQGRQYNEVWSTFPNSNYEESNYNLKNNPWSPDYKPGY